MNHTTFYNLTVSIPGDFPKVAYTKLCNALDSLHAEWYSDTYSCDEEEIKSSTTELFPDNENNEGG